MSLILEYAHLEVRTSGKAGVLLVEHEWKG